jgi:hypothetical protein
MDLIISDPQLRTIRDSAPENSRDHYILPEYVNQYSCQMEQAEVRLHKKDAISVNLWIDRLKEQNMTRSNEAQREAYQECFLECYYCATVRGELSNIPAKTAGPYIHVGQA